MTAPVTPDPVHTNPKPASGRWRKRLARALLWLLMLPPLAALMLWAGHMVLQEHSASGLVALEARIWRFKLAGAGIQLLLLALLAWRWSQLMAWAARRGLIKSSEQAPLVALRWRVIGLLLLFYVLVIVGPGDWGRLYQMVTG